MRVILSDKNLSPYFNLASEQYLLEGEGDVFMIWRNGRSVIIGKNQNAYSEVNVGFCEEKGIKVARRLTGGGAVFHDEGNINFSFVTDKTDEGIDFGRFIEPITDALSVFGIKAEKNGRNDITADGFKISGNAQTVYNTPDGRKRLLHHGTLLFSADISDMTGALNVRKEKLEAKGIKSVSSRVRNICDLDGYAGPRSPVEFMKELTKNAEKRYGVKAVSFDADEEKIIHASEKEKFSTWEWNFGASPSFTNSVSKRFPYGIVELGICSKNGVITSIDVSGDFFGEKDVKELETELVGCRLGRDELKSALSDVGKYVNGATPDDMIGLILGE